MEMISTSDIPTHQRLRFWEESVSSLYARTSVELGDLGDFHGQIQWRKVGQIIVSEIVSSRQTVVREPLHINTHEPSLMQINLQLDGTGTIAQDGRVARTRPGEMAFYDSSRPYEMTFQDGFTQLSLDFPLEILHERFGRAHDFTARTISGLEGPGRFLYAFTRSLVEGGEQDDDSSITTRLQSHLIDLVVTALYGLMPPDIPTASAHRRSTTHRLKTFVNENLRDPGLSPARIAAAHGVSLRYLYDLFADEGITIAKYIMASRLERCRLDLEDTRLAARSVAEIAFAWGFNDAAHFSRAFRSRFGMTPRECRGVAVGEAPVRGSPARLIN